MPSCRDVNFNITLQYVIIKIRFDIILFERIVKRNCEIMIFAQNIIKKKINNIINIKMIQGNAKRYI